MSKKEPIGKHSTKERTSIHMTHKIKGQLIEMHESTGFTYTALIEKAINNLWGDFLKEELENKLDQPLTK